MKLKYLESNENQHFYEHPVMGRIGLRKDVAKKLANNPEAANEYFVEAFANKLKESDEVPSDWESFSTMFSREAGVVESATTRGVYELAGGERTTTYEEDFMDRVYLKTNPWTAYTGMLTGSVADVPSWFVGGPALKGGSVLLKLGKLGGVGAGLGFLQPVREEFGDSRVVNTAISGAGTAALGGAVMAVPPVYNMIAKRLGFKSPKEAQDAYDNASDAVKKEMEDAADKIGDELGLKDLEAEFQANLKEQRRLTEEMLARQDAERQAEEVQSQQYAEDFNTNLERIQSERYADEFNQNLERIQREGYNQDLNARLERATMEAQFKANLRNIQAENAPKNQADKVRADLITELQERIRGVAGTAETGRVASDDVRKLRGALRNVERMLERALDGKKTKLTQDQLIKRRVDLLEDLENAVARRDATVSREQNVKDLVKLKQGKTTPEYNQRLAQAQNQRGLIDIETVTDKDGIIKVAETLSKLPPVPEGHVRMYRGWSPTVSFKDVFNAKGLQQYARPKGMSGDRYTDSIEYADYFRDSFNKNGDARISYVDVPEPYLPSKKVSDNEYLIDLDEVSKFKGKEKVPEMRPRVEQTPKAPRPMSEPPSPEVMARLQDVTRAQPAPPAQATMPPRPMPEAVSRFQEPRMSPIPEGQVPFPTVRQQNPSVGAMGDNLGLEPSAIRQVLMMNTNSRAAQQLPKPRGTQANDLTEPESIRHAALQKYEGESGIADRSFGFETQNGIFSNAAMDAEYEAALRAAESAVRDGEVSSVVEWIGRRAVENNGIDLTTGEIQLLQRQATYVKDAMGKLRAKIRSTERIKTVDDVEALYKAQALSRLYAAFDEMRGIERMSEGTKSRISAIMRSFERTNQMALDEIRELRQGKKINQIYLGLEC